uniref:Uncharacterized protein n=1 Tax=Noccaea caerulescens TaxID=107243 RepID=A0A1J3F8W9_NOCCA
MAIITLKERKKNQAKTKSAMGFGIKVKVCKIQKKKESQQKRNLPKLVITKHRPVSIISLSLSLGSNLAEQRLTDHWKIHTECNIKTRIKCVLAHDFPILRG